MPSQIDGIASRSPTNIDQSGGSRRQEFGQCPQGDLEFDAVAVQPVPFLPGILIVILLDFIHFTSTRKNVKPNYFSGDVVLAVDGEKVGELKDIKSGATYSAMTGYGLVIGRNIGTPVTHEYKPPFAFTGTLNKVTIELK